MMPRSVLCKLIHMNSSLQFNIIDYVGLQRGTRISPLIDMSGMLDCNVALGFPDRYQFSESSEKKMMGSDTDWHFNEFYTI